MSELRRTVRVLWWGWRSEFSAAAEYRADLLSGTLVSALWLGVSVAPLLVVSRYSTTAGWDLPRLLLLAAVWYLLDAVVWMIIGNNSARLDERVRDGSLDGMLLQPVSSLLMCSLRHLYVQDVPKVALAVLLGGYAVARGGGPESWASGLAALLTIACACVLMWAAGVLSSYKALSAVRFDGWRIMTGVHDLARVPTPLYGTALHLLMTVVLPVTFLTTVPAQVFFGDIPLWWAGLSVALAVAVVAVTSRLWRRELGRYTGAMS